MTAATLDSASYSGTNTTTCDRCGNFVPAGSLDLNNHCSGCAMRLVESLPQLSTRGLVAQAGLSGLALAYVLVAVTDEGTVANGLAALLMIGSLLLGSISFLVWFHTAASRTAALGGIIQGSPAYAVGSFFIPFVNLVHPYRVARAMLQTAGRSTGVVTVWQLLWLASGVLTWGAGLTQTKGTAVLVSNLLAAASLAACVIVIRRAGALEANASSPE